MISDVAPLYNTPITMSDSTSEPQPTFEDSLAQLQQIVHDLEEGNLGLEASLARFEQGTKLLRNCYQFLERAEQKIEILTGTNAAGEAVTATFEATATFEVEERVSRKPRRRGGGKGTKESGAATGESGTVEDNNTGGLTPPRSPEESATESPRLF